LIHRFVLNNINFVLDTHSNSVHVLDDLAFDMLNFLNDKILEKNILPEKILNNFLKKYKKEEIAECFKELYFLYKNKKLFSEDNFENLTSCLKNLPIKSMCLNIAHDCNLKCKYCFAAKGDFGTGRKLMSFDTGKKAIDFLIKNSGPRKNLEVDFFGGEPLLNFQVIKEIVNYSRNIEKKYNKNFRFTLTTNGLLLNDENIKYINQEMHNVVLSLDGRKKINDKFRVNINGDGCYDKIISKFKKLVLNRGEKDYYIRGTFTRENLNFTEDILHINSLGFKNISIEPVVCDKNLPYSIRGENLEEIYKEYNKLANILLKNNNFNFFHFNINLNQGPCAIKRLRGCSCGNEYIAITPEGDIYPCHQFVGNDSWKMGNLHENTFNKKIKNYFSETHIYSKKNCKDCWAKFYCSGGCNANNFQYAGQVNRPYEISCKLQKKRLECAIFLVASKQAL